MTSMPSSDDRLLASFQRTAKRRASYRPAQGGRVVAGAQRVLLQRTPGCSFVHQGCITKRGEVGICDDHLNCMADPFPGGFRF
jgi:hypothetical protein